MKGQEWLSSNWKYTHFLINHHLCSPAIKKWNSTSWISIVLDLLMLNSFCVVNYFIFLTGVGALYVRKRPRVRLEPIISGGGQERGLRSGTVPSPLAVGLGAACSICKQEMDVRISTWKCIILFRKWDSSNSVLKEMYAGNLHAYADHLQMSRVILKRR
jgi:hypothetical protein